MSDPVVPTSSPATPDVGATLGGKYRVLRRIGEGGMGVVVEAENLVTGKRVAIKWMHPQVASRPEAAERFLREARASARVRHPNVVDVYDAVHDATTCFLVMELLEGEPLTYVLERGGMPAHELIALLLDAMRGVAAAHKQGVIHRDIKPDNIFLAVEGDRGHKIPKVLDFGISKVTGSDAMSLTRTGATMGTPMYMSYEQICGVKDIDVRTDVYAFGVILYEALTGQPPFHAESFPELIVKITNTQPTPPKQIRPDIPRSLERLVQRAMAREREDRVASLEALIRELEPFATASSFRAQMTADDAPLPRLPARSDEPPKPVEPSKPPFVVEGRESQAIATPMEANVPVPAIPRRRDALPWIIGGGAILSVLGALTFFSGPGAQPIAPASVAPLPLAASKDEPLPPPAATPASPPTPAEANVPAAKRPSESLAPKPATPARPQPAASSDDTAAAATAERERLANEQKRELEAKRKAAAAAATTARPTSSGVARPIPSPPSAASAHSPTAPAAAKAPPAAPLVEPNRFRAGRPRSQDF